MSKTVLTLVLILCTSFVNGKYNMPSPILPRRGMELR